MQMEEVRGADQKNSSEEYTIEMLQNSVKAIRDDKNTDLWLYFLLKDKEGKMYLKEVVFEDIEQDDLKKDNGHSDKERQGATAPKTDGVATKDKGSEDIPTDSANEDNETKRQPLKKMYLDYLDEILVKNSNADLCSLSEYYGRPDDVYLCDGEQFPDDLSLYLNFDPAKILSTSPDEIITPRFNALTDKLERLHGYIAYIRGAKRDGLILFTRHYPVTRIKRNTFMLGILKNSQFKRVDDMDILRFTGKAHLLRIDGHTIALDLDVLERDLGFKKVTTDSAQKIVNKMKEKWGMFAVTDELDEIVKDYRLARKLVRASKHSPVMTPPDLVDWGDAVKYFQTTPELRDTFKFDDAVEYGKKKVDLSTPKARKAFVSLLDDDYLKSPLSKSLYVASYKKTVSAQKSSKPKE